jgi:hypothetical protein
LIENTTDLTTNVTGSLPEKIQEIQASLLIWLLNHPEQHRQIELLMTQLDQDVKAGNYQDARTTADAILTLIRQ